MRDVVSLESQINKTQRELDDAEWEGEPSDHIRKHLDSLIQLQLKGDVWFPLF